MVSNLLHFIDELEGKLRTDWTLVVIFVDEPCFLVCTLEGHGKNVSSLTVLQLSSESKSVTSSRPKALLLSGSLDGTACIWYIQRNESNNNNNNNDNGIKYDCLFTLTGHENTVSVHGLPPPSNIITQ